LLFNLRAGLLAAVSALALSACAQSTSNPAGGSAALPAATQSTEHSGTTPALAENRSLPVGTYHAGCGPVKAPDEVRCLVLIRDDAASRQFGPDGKPSGYGPSDLQSAYNFNPTGGSGVTVAIVDAFDNPNLESDLQVYRAEYGLPVCDSANGCLTKVNQTGGSNLPKGNPGWGSEMSLDVDMVSANCPNCKILVVEGSKPTYADLGQAVATAAALGAATISNSYSGSEFKTQNENSPYDQNRPVMASSGDDGYGVGFPAASLYTFAVGGTTLTKGGGSRGWTETVWSGTGSGCAKVAGKPSWQTDKGCKNRTMGDIAYDADPNTGVAVYDTYGGGGWQVYGGTSVSSPAIAAMFAAAGNAASIQNASWIWNPANHGASSINDITVGSNGTCKVAYLCTAEVGYDGPTGWGTPNGLSGL
jgi:subtilase family serine protease